MSLYWFLPQRMNRHTTTTSQMLPELTIQPALLLLVPTCKSLSWTTVMLILLATLATSDNHHISSWSVPMGFVLMAAPVPAAAVIQRALQYIRASTQLHLTAPLSSSIPTLPILTNKMVVAQVKTCLQAILPQPWQAHLPVAILITPPAMWEEAALIPTIPRPTIFLWAACTLPVSLQRDKRPSLPLVWLGPNPTIASLRLPRE